MNNSLPPISVGQRFSRLVTIEPARVQDRPGWNCLCDCGKKHVVQTKFLFAGKIKSCGCYRISIRKNSKNRRHGMKGTPTYKCWQSMVERCHWQGHKSYGDYGGAGIIVCPRWRSFERFFEDMGLRPDGHSIDRINNTRGYELGNCRWATCTQQARNRSNNRHLSALGETKIAAEWLEDPRCLSTGPSLYKRLQNGWSPERAILTPMRSMRSLKQMVQA